MAISLFERLSPESQNTVSEFVRVHLANIQNGVDRGEGVESSCSVELSSVILDIGSMATRALNLKPARKVKTRLNEAMSCLETFTSLVPRNFDVSDHYWSGVCSGSVLMFQTLIEKQLHQNKELWVRFDGQQYVDSEDMGFKK